MSYNATNVYDVESHIAEIYDQLISDHDDVDLILSLVKHGKLGVSASGAGANTQFSGISILEPFCGTGRILLPLAQAGYTLVGLDQAAGMLDHARQKLARLSSAVQSRVTLCQADVSTDEWPSGFDLVVLGGNCLYELATPEEQEHVIRSAAASLKPGGYVYVDNDHMEGELIPSWQEPGVMPGFPNGVCADGTRVESTIETIWFDAPARLAKFRRTSRVYMPGSGDINHHSTALTASGKVIEVAYIQQKHPVSKGEVQTWLEHYGFVIEKTFGDRAGNPYNEQSPRAIFLGAETPWRNLLNLDMQTVLVADKPVLRNLLQLCLHDYSEFNGEEVDQHGIFNYDYLDNYWTEPGRYAFLARLDGKLAGFVLVRQLDPGKAEYHIAEFFILRKYRGRGLGRQIAFWVFAHFPGEWMVSQEACNHPAQAFWRKIIADYTGGAFTDGIRDDSDWRGPTQLFHSPPIRSVD